MCLQSRLVVYFLTKSTLFCNIFIDYLTKLFTLLNKLGIIFLTACTNLNIANIIPLELDPSNPRSFSNGKSFTVFKIFVCFPLYNNAYHRIVFIYIQFVFIDAYVCLNGGEINDSNVIRNRRDVLGLHCYCNVLILCMM